MSSRLFSFLRRHPMMANLLLLTFSALFSLVIAEIALRAVQGAYSTNHHELLAEYHPVLGWQKKPSFSGTHVGPNGIYRVRETMNSRGIRGPEYSYEKPPQEFRIIALGDSFAEGYTVEFEDLFSEVLKRRLNKDQSTPVEVINAGTGGYSTDQELLWFTTEGVKYNPDLVVLLFVWNDILFNTVDRYSRGYKPLFRIEDGTLELTNVPVPPPASPAPLSFKQWLYKSSYLYRNTRDTLLKSEQITNLLVWIRLAQPRKHSATDVPKSDANDSSQVPDYIRLSDWSKATEQERRAGWKITEMLLLKLKTEVEAAGSKLLVMIVVPGISEVLSRVMSICRQNSIDCIDPSPRFRAEDIATLTFAPLDWHWNAEGHRRAAELLREHIVTHSYLPQQPD